MAEGDVQLAVAVEDPILRIHIFRVDKREPANAIVDVGGFGVEKIAVDLCRATSG